MCRFPWIFCKWCVLLFAPQLSHNSTLRAREPRCLRTLHVPNSFVLCAAFHPDGRTLAVGYDHAIMIWDLETGKSLATLLGHEWSVLSLAYSPDGKTLASGGLDERIRIWDVATWKEVGTWKSHTGPVNSVVFSPDMAAVLASASHDETVKLWDFRTGRDFALLKVTAIG